MQRQPWLRIDHCLGAEVGFILALHSANQNFGVHAGQAPGLLIALAASAGASAFSSRVFRFFSLTASSPAGLRSSLSVKAALSSWARLNCLSDLDGVRE